MKSFKELMEIVAPDVKTDLKALDATSFSKKHGKSKTEIKNTFESAEKKVPEPGREAVGGRFTSRPPKSVIRPAPQVTSEGVRKMASGGRDNAGGQYYDIDNSDGTIGFGYKPGKSHPSSSHSNYKIKSEPKHPLRGKLVTAKHSNGQEVTGRMMGTEHQGTVAKIKHSSGVIHHTDAETVKKANSGMKEDIERVDENSDEASRHEAYNHYKKQVLPIYKKHGLSPEFAKAVNNHVAKHGSYQVWNHHGDADGQNPHWFDSEKQKVKPIKQKRGYEVSEEVVAEAIVGKPKYSEPNQSGRGLHSAADYMVRTNHQLDSHEYTAVTEVDGDGDRYYFIYQKGKKEPVFYATDMGQFVVRTDNLGKKVSNAIITAHKKATDRGLEKYMNEDIKRIEEMDKSQTPPGRDGGYQFAPGPKVSKKDIEAVKKNPAKHLSDLFAKEYAKKKMKEEVVDEAKDPKEYGYEGDMAMNQLQTIMRHAEYLMDMMKPDTDLPEWVQSKITLATDYLQTSCDYMTSEMKEEVEQIDEDMTKDVQKTKDGGYWSKGVKTATHYSGKKTYEWRKFDKEGKETGERHYRDAQGNYMGEEVEPPFKADKPKQRVVPGKAGKGYSTARHLARMAMQKQVDKLKKPVKESLEESRKAEIVKDIVKKKKATTEDTFQKDPELSSSLTKTQ